MKIVNLTPHSVDVYRKEAFKNLEQKSQIWVADSVDPEGLIFSFQSDGVARINTDIEYVWSIRGIPTFKTVYGEPVGIPDDIDPNDILIVSLPFASMAKGKVKNRMMSPYEVVRSRENSSLVFGCMGLTEQ